jgi:porphobilinogen synthase
MKTNRIGNSVSFPALRLRRLRRTAAIRDLVQETRLSVKDLIAPIFVQDGIKRPRAIESMPEIYRLPTESLIDEIQSFFDLGLRSVLLFGVPLRKDDSASSAFDDTGVIQRAIGLIRKHFGNKIVIATDVCLCQYTVHGHCGIVSKSGHVDNDSSIKTLAKVAASHASAGADIVAPSAMMDGQVQEIRIMLDGRGFSDVAIMAYSAKHASPLYAPFRDAAHSTPEFGDRRSYQMPFSNSKEAMREIEADINEGADIVMIKPAIPYLDIIHQARNATNVPICAYSVSGEYSMIKAAAIEGWIDEDSVVTEFLTSIKRAGAGMIVTYHAKKMAELLNQ